MVCMSSRYIRKALRASQDLMMVADQGEHDTEDAGCSVLFGVIRDCAHKIRSQAEREMRARQALGVWVATDDNDGQPAGAVDRTPEMQA